MGSSVEAKLLFGYPLPDLDDKDFDYEDLPEWYDEDAGFDLEEAWFQTHGPAEVKLLDLTKEEHDLWNSIPYPKEGRREDSPEYRAFSSKYGTYLEARREWLRKNPCPAHLEYVGAYDEGEHFLVVMHEGSPVMISTDWTARRITREDLKEPMSTGEAKAMLDDFCTSIGLPVGDEPVGWFLAPLYG